MTIQMLDVPAAVEHFEKVHKQEQEKLQSDLRFVVGSSGVNMRSLADVAEDCLVQMASLCRLMELLGLPVQALIDETHKGSGQSNIQKVVFDHFRFEEDRDFLGKGKPN